MNGELFESVLNGRQMETFKKVSSNNVQNDVSWRKGTIYQPLRSGRIWHKVNF